MVFHSFTKRIEALPLDGGSSQAFTVIETPQEERNAVVSPDGRWLAYEADSPTLPGRLDVFVRPFPDVDRGPTLVSHGWRRPQIVGNATAARDRGFVEPAESRSYRRAALMSTRGGRVTIS